MSAQPCPECYGGHFKPCQICGDSGWIEAQPMNPKKTETLTLAYAMDALAREIQSGDGIANAAIAEAADRLRETLKENERLDGLMAQRDERIVALLQEVGERRRDAQKDMALVGRLRRALTDAIATYDPTRKETLVTAERQEAWIAALKEEA